MHNIGDILDGRYRLISMIGQGGMATVYRARDEKLGRDVAVKILKEEFSSDNEFIERFKNEARSAARLSHSNIVAAYDIVNNGALHYIVMELVEGITLRDYIARKGRLSNKETIGIALQTAEGLSEAHKNNVIHRDIKSQNIIISREGRIKIGDFGIAKVTDAHTHTASSQAAVMGSAHYMSPEQAATGKADARSDIYSLGISMYEMITGRLPYQGEDVKEVIEAHLRDAMVPPSVYNSSIYPALNDIILKATKKEPQDRYASADELIADLRHAAAEPDAHFVKMYDSVGSGELDKSSGAEGAEAAAGAMAGTAGTVGAAGAAEGLKTAAYADTNDSRSILQGAQESADVQSTAHDSIEFKTDSHSINTEAAGEAEAADGDDEYGITAFDDSRTRFIVAGITAAVVLIAVIIGIFVLRSGSDAADTAQSNMSVLENGTSEEESTGEMDYTLSIQGEDIMPDLVGMTVDEARAKLASIRMSMDSSTTDYSDTYEKGMIMNQSPAKNEVLNADSTVYVTVSLGRKSDYVLDNLKNMTVDEADAAILDAGMALSDSVTREFSDEVAEDLVVGYTDDGKTDDGKRRVALVLSYGKKENYVEMPDISYTEIRDASYVLKESGLTLGKITAVNTSDTVAGDVISQSVDADDYVKKGSSIDVEVCVGDDYTIDDGIEFEDADDLYNTLDDASSVSVSSSQTVTDAAGGSGSSYSGSSDYYYGSIDESCVIGEVSGPGSSSTINVAVRLAQRVDGSMEYSVISEPIPVAAGTKIPVSFKNIRGAYGVAEGIVEVYGVDTGTIYSSYVIHFSAKK